MNHKGLYALLNEFHGKNSIFQKYFFILLSGFLIASIALSFSRFQIAPATGTDRYVATSGIDGTNDCLTVTSPCATIKYAIGKSNGGDTIHIATGTYNEQPISINKSLVLIGAGMTATILNGDATDAVIYTYPGSSDTYLTLTDMTIQNGSANVGGGVFANGITLLTITRVKVTQNQAKSAGGIYSSGSLTMTDSIISENFATTISGGGIMLEGSTGASFNLSRVTISRNSAHGYSGGIHHQGNGVLNLENVTISDNTAAHGGAMANTASANTTILNGTVEGNHFSVGGSIGGILNFGTVTVKNSLFSGNDGANCSGSITSQGYNIDSGITCVFTSTGDQQSVTDPKLGPLQDNGGPTPTIALLPGSPAINFGTITGCPATDQRGVIRPQGASCDIGAYEVEELPLAFNKTSPSNGKGNLPVNLTLKWGASIGAASYEYCYDKTNDNKCGTGWKSAGTGLSAAITDLSKAKYYWQVRAKNGAGTTKANNGTWWSFTVPPIPGAFSKTGPANNSVNRPMELNLYWAVSANAASYEYCIDKTNDNACGTGWKSMGISRNVHLTGLLKDTKYYWQVRAKNASGKTLANAGVWWNFKTVH